MKKFRIMNTTHQAQPPAGFVLYYAGKPFRAGRHVVIDEATIPEIIQQWAQKGWVHVQNAETGDTLAGGEAYAGGVIAGAKVDSLIPEGEIEHDEIGFDPAAAVEASLPRTAAGAHMPPTDQGGRVRTTPALAEERHSQDISPIPGETPRSVDDSGHFTVRAPHNAGLGAVMKP